MKDMEVLVKKEFVRGLLQSMDEDGGLQFWEFLSRLDGVFGTWDRLASYEKFLGKAIIYGDDILKEYIPSKYGMIIALKKIVSKYGASNFVFRKEKGSNFEEYVSLATLHKVMLSAIVDGDIL